SCGARTSAGAIVERRDTRKRFAFEQLEGRTAPRRYVAHCTLESQLGHRSRRVAAADDGGRTISRRSRHRLRHCPGARIEWRRLEHAHGPVPYDSLCGADDLGILARRLGTYI